PEGIPAAADIVNLRYKSCSEMEGQDHPTGNSVIELGIPSFIPISVGRCALKWVDLERASIAGAGMTGKH
ncbi:hypothetical protein NL354_14465, partial [Klebsiella pneumoniae]|nr:hypothetical protein [Klebsiella pneumoniae]